MGVLLHVQYNNVTTARATVNAGITSCYVLSLALPVKRNTHPVVSPTIRRAKFGRCRGIWVAIVESGQASYRVQTHAAEAWVHPFPSVLGQGLSIMLVSPGTRRRDKRRREPSEQEDNMCWN
jgi:hypothetical protein